MCRFCGQEKAPGVGCTLEVFDGFADGIERERVRHGDEWTNYTPKHPCHDCGAGVGQLHHYFCDAEPCPRCGGQVIFCECWDDPEPAPTAFAPQPWPWFCADCGVDNLELGEDYMVHDELWPQEVARGTLCIGCLERRIGRRLRPDDFPDLPINHAPGRSRRLRARIGH